MPAAPVSSRAFLRFRWRPLVAVAAILALSDAAEAQLPAARLATIFPPGGRQGNAVEVTIGGTDLDGAGELIFSHPGITAVEKTTPPGPFDDGPRLLAGQFTVTIAADVPPGIYEVRAAGRFGITNSRAFVVSNLSEAVEAEPNNTLAEAGAIDLGTVINGRAGGATDVDFFRFQAAAGQRVLIECLAWGIDSRLDSSLVLYDAAGRELDRNRRDLKRDALIDFKVPAEGAYAVKVHDFVYGGSAEHFYRLSISAAPRVDFVLPAAALPGSKGRYTVYGRNLPGGRPAAGQESDGKPLEMLEVEIEAPASAAAEALAREGLIEPAEAALDGFTWRLDSAPGAGWFLSFATAPVVLEVEPNDEPGKAQKLAPPCEYIGQFYPRLDDDWVEFEAKKGDTYWIEVFSHRLGLPVDPFLLVQQVTRDDKGEEKVTELQGADDLGANIGGAHFNTASDDPAYRFVAPADATYRVLVRDLYHGAGGDPRHVYRLAIRPERPDFRLVALSRFPGSNPDPNQNPPNLWSPFLRRGGTEWIDVLAFRRDGFGGEIALSIDGLPPGVACSGAVIGPGKNAATLVLRAADHAPAWRGRVRITGKALIGGAEVAREARAAAVVWPGVQGQVGARARLAGELALAVSGAEAAPFLVEAAAESWETSKAGSLSIPLRLTRHGDFKGKVAVAALDLPPNVQAKGFTFEENASEGNIELAVAGNAPLGAFSFHLQATAQVAYGRSPEVAERLAERKERLEKLAAELAQAAKLAAEERAAAEKNAADAASAAERAAGAQAQATGELRAAADQVKAVAEELKAAAERLRTSAAEKAAEAEDKAKAAAAAQAAAAKEAEEAAKAAKPANVNVLFPAAALRLRIAAAPIALSAGPPARALKRGGSIEVPVAIERLYGYAGAVEIGAEPPAGAAGLKAAAISIPAEQSLGILVIEAAADATQGRHAVTIKATAKLKDQSLQASQTISVVVE
jgi:hypothetical protein